MPAELVSVGITAYNAASSIEAAVRTALEQTYAPLEVVIVDDASTDGTREALEHLAAIDERIRLVVHEANRGVAAARNTILRHAQGQFIAFFDDDDRSHPDRVRTQVERLKAYEARFSGRAPVLCHVSRTVVHPDGSREYRRAMGSEAQRMGPHGRQLADHLLCGGPLPATDHGTTGTCAQLGRTSTYERLGGFDERFRRGEDSELNVRLARAGGHLIGVAAPLLEQHVTSTADKRLPLRLEMELLLLAVHRDAFPDTPTYAAARRWLQAKYAWMADERAAALHRLTLALLLSPRTGGRRLREEVAPRLLARLQRRRRGPSGTELFPHAAEQGVPHAAPSSTPSSPSSAAEEMP